MGKLDLDQVGKQEERFPHCKQNQNRVATEES
ncbi:hypothetical protein PM8797T_19984 [Gimesia maris DSM 8797]|nr:hypothetical protein PM8797T_19984 [Gimesia maris DSM 8797]